MNKGIGAISPLPDGLTVDGAKCPMEQRPPNPIFVQWLEAYELRLIQICSGNEKTKPQPPREADPSEADSD